MTSIIGGTGLGLYQSSLNVLGGRAPSGGDPTIGRNGNQAYVNAFTGNLVLQQNDGGAVSIGPDISYFRTYNSLGKSTDSGGQLIDENADNWMLGIQLYLRVVDANTIIKTFGDGTEVKFIKNGSVYVSTEGSGAHDTITAFGASWIYSDGNSGVTETYSGYGSTPTKNFRIVSRQDRDGNVQNYTYLVSGITVNDPVSGQSAEYSLLSGGRVYKITFRNPADSYFGTIVVNYQYDNNNRLSSVSLNLTRPDSNQTTYYVTTYTYDDSPQTPISKRIKTVTNTSEGTTQDGASLTVAYISATDNRVASITDSKGRSTTYNYVQVTGQLYTRYTEVTDEIGRKSTYYYDSKGQLLYYRSPTLADNTQLVTEYQYDNDGNVLRVIDSSNNATTMAYDAQGNLLRQQDAAGNVVEYTYTATNQLARQTVYFVPDPDQAGPGQAADPRYTHFVYDAEDHLRFTVSPEGRVAEYRYSSNGTRSASIVYNTDVFSAGETTPSEATLATWVLAGRDLTALTRTDYQYNSRGEVSTSTVWGATDTSGNGVAGTGASFYSIYDREGRLVKSVDARGHAPIDLNSTGRILSQDPNNFETLYVYDELGRLISTYDPSGALSNVVYDDTNRAMTTTAANGLVRTSYYDRNGRLISVSETDDASHSLGTVKYFYDDAGQLRGTQDASGGMSYLFYDAAGRVVASLDALGLLTETVYGKNNGPTIQTSYATRVAANMLNNLALRDGSNAVIGVNMSITLATAEFRPASSVDDRRTYRLYDEAGRLVYDFDAEGYVTETRYNGAGEIIETVRHATPFPGFVDNNAASVDVALTTTQTGGQTLTNAQLTWVQDNLANNSHLKFSLVREDTDEAISLDLDLEHNTGTVDGKRMPNQPFETDNFAAVDTRTTVEESPPASIVFDAAATVLPPPHLQFDIDNEAFPLAGTVPGVGPNGSDGPGDTMAEVGIGPVNVNVIKDSSSALVVDGIKHTSSPQNLWEVRLQKKGDLIDDSNNNWADVPTARYTTSEPDVARFATLGTGIYRAYTVAYVNGAPTGAASAVTKFQWQVPKPVLVKIPKPAGIGLNMTSMDFYYRDQTKSGTEYDGVVKGVMGQNEDSGKILFTLPLELIGKTIDFKIIGFRGTGHPDVVAISNQFGLKVVPKVAGVTGECLATWYRTQSNTGNQTVGGQSLVGVLPLEEIGTLGAEYGTKLDYVDVEVYDLKHPNTMIYDRPIRTYPSVIAAITGNTDGRINISANSTDPLADGMYRFVLTKHYLNGATKVQTIEDFQVGNISRPTQTIILPASTQPLETVGYASFFYRRKGSTGDFKEVKFIPGSAQPLTTYFDLDAANNYKVFLFGLIDGATYEYKVEYRAPDKQLLKFTGVNEFATSTDGNSTVKFSHYQDTSVARSGGTRLNRYLSPEQAQETDYLSVNVFKRTSKNPDVYQLVQGLENVLTIPGADPEHSGSLNLSRMTPLADGAYRIDVTRNFKDPTLAKEEVSFSYEIGLQDVDKPTQSLTIQLTGNEIKASISKIPNSNSLAFVNNLELTINRSTKAASLQLNAIVNGPYGYVKSVSTDSTHDPEEGRFAAYSGNAPNLAEVRGFYNYSHATTVKVTQGIATSGTRPPHLPDGYVYQNSALILGTGTTVKSLTVTAKSVATSTGITTTDSGNYINVDATPHNQNSTVGQEYVIINRITGEVVYNKPSTLNKKSTSIPPPSDFVMPYRWYPNVKIEDITPALPPGDYTIVVKAVNQEISTNVTVNNGQVTGTITANYVRGPEKRIDFSWKNTPSTASVSWDILPDTGGKTVTFEYSPAGLEIYKFAAVTTGAAKVTATLQDPVPDPGYYAYRIFYKDYNNQNVIMSSGMFRLETGKSLQFTNDSVYTDTASKAISGSSIKIPTLIDASANITKVEAWVYKHGTSTLVSRNDKGDLGATVTLVPTSEDLRAINLSKGAVLPNGAYDVRLRVTYENGTQVFFPDSDPKNKLLIEVGPQAVPIASTELRWDGSKRPPNTDVYFRYKPVSVREFDTQNEWIRATASQTLSGEFIIRFPQLSPDGNPLPIPAGKYDYMVAYKDRVTGKFIESALGEFTVGLGEPSEHQLNFTRDLEGRHTRVFTNDLGQVIGTLNGMGYFVENIYDDAGRLVETVRYAQKTSENLRAGGTFAQMRPDKADQPDANNQHEYFYYNNKGQLVMSVNAERYVSEYAYDAAGNQTQVTVYATRAPEMTFAGANPASVRPAASPNDRVTVTTFTSRNLVSRVTQKVGTDILSTTEYTYDVMGRLLSSALKNGDGTDERILRTRYDLEGRVVKELTGEGSFELAKLSNLTQAQIDAIWDKYSVRYAYDIAGHRISQTDVRGNITRYYYDEVGQVAFVIDAAGEVVENVYTTFGNIASTIQYSTRLADAASAGIGGMLTPQLRSMFAALRNNAKDSVVVNKYNQRGLVVLQTDELGNNTSFEYDGFGAQRFARHVIHGGVNDGRESTAEYIYDALGRRTNELDGPEGGIIARGHDYDAFNREIATYVYDSAHDRREMYGRRYDRLGNVAEVFEVVDIDPTHHIDTKISGFKYDAFNRVLEKADGNGQTTKFSYNDKTRAVTIETPEGVSTTTTANVHGETVDVKDGTGKSIQYEYDKNGRLKKQTDREGNQTRFEYDDANRRSDTINVTNVLDGSGVRTTTTYDKANRVLTRVVDAGGLALTTSYTYDAAGRAITVTDPMGTVTQTCYDRKGQVTSITVDPTPATPDGKSHLNQAVYYTYDSQGHQLTVSGGDATVMKRTAADGTVTIAYEKALNTMRYEYDIHGRVIKKVVAPDITYIEGGQSRTIAGLNIATQYDYDVSGNLVASTDSRNVEEGGHGYTTRYVYDDFKRLIYTVNNLGDDYGQVIENRYDVSGNLTQVIRHAKTISLATFGRVIGLADVQQKLVADPANDQTQRRFYDRDGRLVYTLSPSRVVEKYIYDAAGRVAHTNTYAESIANAEYADADAVGQALNAQVGNFQKAKLAHRNWQVYDANGRVLYDVTTLGYEKVGTTEQVLGHVKAFTYDQNGNRLSSVEYANAMIVSTYAEQNISRAAVETWINANKDGDRDRLTRYAFDAVNRQIQEIDALDYATRMFYDAMGRETSRIKYANPFGNNAGLISLPPSVNDRVTTNYYDAANRVTETIDAENNHEKFGYDAAGNRIWFQNANNDVWTYRYDGANRLIEELTPKVNVTRLDHAKWDQNFNGNLDGITIDPALPLNAYEFDDVTQSLVLKEGIANSPTYVLKSGEEFNLEDKVRLETIFVTGGDTTISTLQFAVGALANNGAKHRLVVSGGKLWVQYNNAALKEIGVVEANTRYIVDFVVDAQFTYLSVYKQGQARTQGFVDKRAWTFGWGVGVKWSLDFTSHANVTNPEAKKALYVLRARIVTQRSDTLEDDSARFSAQVYSESISTRYEYDALNNVRARIEAAGTPEERRTEYGYDAMGHQISTTYRKVSVYSQSADAGANYANSIREENLMPLTSLTYYDAFGNAVMGTDALGNRSYKVYDANNRLVYDVDAEGYVTKNDYDVFGNVTSVTRYGKNLKTIPAKTGVHDAGLTRGDVESNLDKDDKVDRVLSNQYDLMNRVTRVTQAAVLNVQRFDDQRAVLSASAPETENVYDGFGNLIRQSTLADDKFGDEFRRISTLYYYDRNGQCTAMVDAGGYVTKFTYDLAGNLTDRIEYATAINLSNIPTSTDALVTAVPKKSWVGADPAALPATGLDRETSYRYDKLNWLTREKQIGAIVGNVVVVNGGNSDVLPVAGYTISDIETRALHYDGVGNLLDEINGIGKIQRMGYDALGRLTGQTEFHDIADTEDNEKSPVTKFLHDAFGNVVRQTRYFNEASLSTAKADDEGRDQITHQYYDTFGRLLRADDAQGHATSYSYTATGQLAKEWYEFSVGVNAKAPDNTLMAGKVYIYDKVGQQTKMIELAENIELQPYEIQSREYRNIVTQTTYNAFGEITGCGFVENNEYRESEYYEYDQAGRLWRTNAEDGNDKIYLYDRQGNRIETLMDSELVLKQQGSYDDLKNLVNFDTLRRVTMKYDDLGRAIVQTNPGHSGVRDRTEVRRDYDRWGNVIHVTDAGNSESRYQYDQTNRQLKQELAVEARQGRDPGVWVVGENGQGDWVIPTSTTYYDKLGRVVASKDANNNVQATVYDAKGRVDRTIAGDGGITTYDFDTFGNLTKQFSYAGWTDTQKFGFVREYDKNNRVIHEYTTGNGDTKYQYDEAGHLIKVKREVYWNRSAATLYEYDNRGNLIEEKLNARIDFRDEAGSWWFDQPNIDPIVHRYLYDDQNRKVVEQRYIDSSRSNPRALSSVWKYNYFGRLEGHIDMDGGKFDYRYYNTGELKHEEVTHGEAPPIIEHDYLYFGDGLLKQVNRTDHRHNATKTDTVDYLYYASGRVREERGAGDATYTNTYQYDSLGRLAHMHGDNGLFDSPKRDYFVDMDYFYDAVGNRRRVYGDEGKNADGSFIPKIDQWYAYDGANRVTISRGGHNGTQIVLGNGTRLAYDKAGHRTETTWFRGNGQVTETHEFDSDGRVVLTREKVEGGSAKDTSERKYDFLGRVIEYTAYDAVHGVKELRKTTYNDNGLLSEEKVSGTNGSATYNYHLPEGSYDDAGNLLKFQVETGGFYNTYEYSEYRYFDDFKVGAIQATSTDDHFKTNTLRYTYDAFGVLEKMDNSNADELKKSNVTFTLNAAGQVVHKRVGEAEDAKHQFYYLANGTTIGTGGEIEVDFDYNAKPLSGQDAVSATPGNYVVRAGDDLQSIALACYGDASLWYIIADANGLTANEGATPGRTLVIPGVETQRNSVSAFKPFGSGRIVGNMMPNMPFVQTPAAGIGACGVVANIIIIAVAAVASMYLGPLAANMFSGFTPVMGGILGGAATGAATNVLSQDLRVAFGLQDDISWKDVGASALSGGIAGGVGAAFSGLTKPSSMPDGVVGPPAPGPSGFDKTVQQTLNAMGSNALTQGAHLALGMQEKFNWSSFAIAAISAPVAGVLQRVTGLDNLSGRLSPGGLGKHLAQQAISSGVNSAATLLVNQDGKMDWAQVAADVFGNAIGNAIVDHLNSVQKEKSEAKQLQLTEEQAAKEREEALEYARAMANDVERPMAELSLLTPDISFPEEPVVPDQIDFSKLVAKKPVNQSGSVANSLGGGRAIGSVANSEDGIYPFVERQVKRVVGGLATDFASGVTYVFKHLPRTQQDVEQISLDMDIGDLKGLCNALPNLVDAAIEFPFVAGRYVRSQTGLEGKYDFAVDLLKWTGVYNQSPGIREGDAAVRSMLSIPDNYIHAFKFGNWCEYTSLTQTIFGTKTSFVAGMALGEVAGVGLAKYGSTDVPVLYEATKLYGKARWTGGGVSELMGDIAYINDGELVGLSHKYKTFESFVGKIIRDSAEKKSYSAAAEGIEDGLRFTIQLPEENFGANTLDVIHQMQGKGLIKLKVSNTFQAGEKYMGVNTNFVTAEGQVFEVQFHTGESFAAKQVTHPLYQQARNRLTPPWKADYLDDLQRAYNIEHITIPKDVNLVKEFRLRLKGPK